MDIEIVSTVLRHKGAVHPTVAAHPARHAPWMVWAVLALTLGALPAPVSGQPAVVEYYHLDALGSVRAVTGFRR